MKKHIPSTEMPSNGASAPASVKAVEELERRVVNQQRNLPATSVEYDYAADKALAGIRVTIFGTPEDVVQYFVARARTVGSAEETVTE